MNQQERQDLKKAISDASDAMSDLNHFVQMFSLDVRNVAIELQSYGRVDLCEIEARGKDLRKKSDKALAAVREMYRKVQGAEKRNAA